MADGPATPALARAAEVGLRVVIGGDAPRLPAGVSALTLQPHTLLLSAFKPAEDGDGAIVRVLNPTDDAATAELQFGVPVASLEMVRLDETRGETSVGDVGRDGDHAQFVVPPHALRSIRVRWS
jgi:alpha-mannosidase